MGYEKGYYFYLLKRKNDKRIERQKDSFGQGVKYI